MTNIRVLSPAESVGWERLDDVLLDAKGRMIVPPAALYETLPPGQLRAWCHFRGVYQLACSELVDWARDRIAGRRAIEIGAGRGWLGRALGIPMTDSRVMERLDMAMFYRLTGQPVTPYGDDVEKLEALEAIARYKPEVVIGCWVTQLHLPGDDHGSAFGVDEVRLLDRVSEYIVVGNANVHGGKRICKREHAEFKAPWIWSRAARPELNTIYTWGKG